METKNPIASRTVWFNVILLACQIAALAGFDLGLDTEAKMAMAASLQSVGNIILRFATTKGIALK